MPASLTLFLAPTADEARRAAWETVAAGASPFDPPLVFGSAASAPAWRDLARGGARRTASVPRSARADEFFARAHRANARQRALSGADRAWVLGDVARGLSLDEAVQTLARSREGCAQMGHWIGALRRAGASEFPALSALPSSALNAWLRAYEARLAALGAFDYEAAPSLFARDAGRNRAFAWPQHLAIDDLLDPSPALQSGLRALLERASVVAATLVCPGGSQDNAALSSALRFWRECGADIARCGDFRGAAQRASARILGDGDEESRPSHLRITRAHTPWDEMNRVASQVRRGVESGARPDDFALALADFGAYEASARHAFAAHGVPLDWPRARPLRQSPLVRALLGAARLRRWNVHALHDLFGDGTLQLRDENGALDVRRLRAAALAARHPELDDTGATRAVFEQRIAAWTRHPKNDDAARRVQVERALASADLEWVAQLQTICAPLNEKCSASAWRNRMRHLIETLSGHWTEGSDAPEETSSPWNENNGAAQRETFFDAQAMPQSAARRAAHEALTGLDDAIARVVERARLWSDAERDAPRAASEWLAWLDAELDAGAAPPARGGVRVTDASAPLVAPRATFFCGLSEGAWPAPLSGGPWSAPDRELHAVWRAHEAAPVARATHALARAVGESAGELFFSSAQFVAGDEVAASPLLDDLSALWPAKNNGPWPSLAPASGATRRAQLQSWARSLDASEAARHAAPAPLRALWEMRTQRRGLEIGVYDGVLGAPGAALMERHDAGADAPPWSGSALEFYARCPLRFFFERVLNLPGVDALEDDLDARAAGTLVHEIARGFLAAWPSPLPQADFETALAALGDVAWRECQRLPLRPVLREAEWHRLMGWDGRSGALVKWLKLEMAGGNGAWAGEMRPLCHSGISIAGAGNGLETRFAMEVGGHRVKGFIDRLDIAPDGTRLAVLDYKTGSSSSLPNWKNGDAGLHFQLAIYALAARQLTSGSVAAPRLAMAYITLRDGRIARGIGQTETLGKGCAGAQSLPDATFEKWLDEVGARVARIADLRRAGTFNLSLQNAANAKCGSCDSKTLCGQHAPTQVARAQTHENSPFVYLPGAWQWEQTPVIPLEPR